MGDAYLAIARRARRFVLFATCFVRRARRKRTPYARRGRRATGVFWAKTRAARSVLHRKNMRTVIFFFSILGALLIACSSSDSTCAAGTACLSCSENAACTRTCTGKGCSFQCNGNGHCSFDCPQGGCTAEGNGNGMMTLSCAGGGCRVNCNGNGTCEITGCPTTSPSCSCAKNNPVTTCTSS